jgi:hypothetical protein
MIRVEISDDAQADLNEGFLFYEAQEPGLGDYFIACLRADIEGLKVSAGAHPVVYADPFVAPRKGQNRVVAALSNPSPNSILLGLDHQNPLILPCFRWGTPCWAG